MRAPPGAYPHTVRPPEGGDWLAGDRRWKVNPRFAIPQVYFHIVGLWSRCRSGMGGFAHLPEVGGVNDQPFWLLQAFAVLSAAEAKSKPDT